MSSDENTKASSGTELGELIAQVDDEHGEGGAAAMADQLRDKMKETRAEAETPGDLED